MPSSISYIEIGAGDAATVGMFFGQLFGWTFHPMGAESDGWFETGTIRAGLHGGEVAPRLDLYFQVTDLTAAIGRVRALGGQVDEPTTEAPGFGQFVHCRAPDGLCFGLHQVETLPDPAVSK